jgi:hypothetical protein
MSDAVLSSAAAGLVPYDRDFPLRTYRLEVLRRVLDGSIYSTLPYKFDQERSGAGEYIPLRDRQPSVRYPLSRVVVEDSVALLFSEGHFPAVHSDNTSVSQALGAILTDARINAVMVEAARRGSVGSVAVLLRVLRGRIFLQVLDTLYLTPVWDPLAPDELLCITERYKVSGKDLIARGYQVDDPQITYWFERCWNSESELWYVPQPYGYDVTPEIDTTRSVHHGLGFVPLVWIRNLPGGDEIDGASTFESCIETSFEIDYQLSQAGRGLKYSSDPTLLIKEPAGFDQTMVKGAANALIVSEQGDAKLLEINGSAAQVVIEYVRALREFALEAMHGNRADASRLSTPASGRALELMNQGLVWLSDNLRISYGEGALLPLCRMIVRASSIYPIRAGDKVYTELPSYMLLTLRWPSWYPVDSADRQRDVATILSLIDAKQVSREEGVRLLAQFAGIDASAGDTKLSEVEA